MRVVMGIGTRFETWACTHVAFDELDDAWPYLMEAKFGSTTLAVLSPTALAKLPFMASVSMTRFSTSPTAPPMPMRFNSHAASRRASGFLCTPGFPASRMNNEKSRAGGVPDLLPKQGGTST